jgi:polyisoprenoid-binding protein YceI
MSSTTPDVSTQAESLAGTWELDADGSHARFTARTLAGLVKVPGVFHRLTGTASFDERSTTGTLVIDAASIDTGNRLRDRHLRSSGFFGVSKHPELRYEAVSLVLDGAHVTIDGELLIAGTRIPLPLDGELHHEGDGVIEIACRTRLDRIAAGVRGARGMVPRAVDLHVAVRLHRTR